jgi:hypothetical protein
MMTATHGDRPTLEIAQNLAERASRLRLVGRRWPRRLSQLRGWSPGVVDDTIRGRLDPTMLAVQMEACLAENISADGSLAMWALKSGEKAMPAQDVRNDENASDKEDSTDANPRLVHANTDYHADSKEEQTKSHTQSRALPIQRAKIIGAFDSGFLEFGYHETIMKYAELANDASSEGEGTCNVYSGNGSASGRLASPVW